MLIFVCLLDELILDFYYYNLAREIGGLELSSTITFVLQERWSKKVEQKGGAKTAFQYLHKDAKKRWTWECNWDCTWVSLEVSQIGALDNAQESTK